MPTGTLGYSEFQGDVAIRPVGEAPAMQDQTGLGYAADLDWRVKPDVFGLRLGLGPAGEESDLLFH